ncbi:uncharacterized protein BCR38DRAFT_208045 [Pseudomassariella vexata]|uniref:[histone H3]-trimethyl-L-lysine(9) demethylase n=1 Tax=Pseudomassariella vexata TaxID=1141098 RepID=A0A1Y2DYH1_9PEZI|nr:uncharacterized protein BCR38DRAFT_208045 [Pseudomassariella vexata]ORY64134.1 hypothetical protein BCR38DRAFT_208045 [Pseudomassariella vexata]
MSVEAIAAMAPAPASEQGQIEVANASCATNDALKTTGLHSPPDSNSAMKLDGSDDSELSDLEDADPAADARPRAATNEPEGGVKVEDQDEDDIGEVLPDHWSGTVPVFKPDMCQFKDFKKFMQKVDSYGMKSGIVKIIPPEEWKNKLPALDDLVKQVKVKEPIKQDIMGTNGTYRQVNILHQRSYNLPQWRQLCDQSEHQPPAKRGERRVHQEKPKAASRSKPAASSSNTSAPKKRGRNTRSRAKKGAAKEEPSEQEERPMTPVSPKSTADVVESVEKDPGVDLDEEHDVPVIPRMGALRQPKPKTQSISARRKYAKREASAKIDEEAFKDWDYRMDISDYTPERCEELERIYWKTLTYAPPLYGADLPGTLFDDGTECWNLNKLPNLLDVLGTKVPGVNTAYLYLGMWKATFAWHLEDVDLYSINFLHFGAPKQWYSISQGDARRFEAAMKSIWPSDAKACDQFLRHKAFLISPNHLQQYFNIKVNKCVSYPGEFVVTYPYGYHSGYNLGYNCAEAVNFALDSWLPMGKIAKRCECAQAQDSVWIDVYEIERKLRGEETDYEETEDEEEEEDDDDNAGIQTSQASHMVKIKQPIRKRKRSANDKGDKTAKKIRLRVRIKTQVEPPCCLCPNHLTDAELLPTDDGRKAHRICALYGPETWIETVDDKEVVANTANISKARLDLKCLYCRSKRGACFQCSQRKCARSYHATCAAAAGVFIEEGEVPIFGEDGTEYKEQAFEFSCRFHRTKRDKKLDGEALDECTKTRQVAAALKKGNIAQLQYYRGDIFAGVVIENRHDEQTLLVEIIPNGDRVEVEWKWLLLPDPTDYRLQKASPNAIPMPTSRKAKDEINATKRATEELPRADAPFVDGFTWAEFNTGEPTNKAQAKVDFSKDNQVWHYLGKTSTEARAQYTEDPKKCAHNSKSNFLDTLPRATPASQPRKSYTPTYPMPTPAAHFKSNRPYQYKPKQPVTPSFVPSPYTAQQLAPTTLPTFTSAFTPQNTAARASPPSLSTFAPQTAPKSTFSPNPQSTPKPTLSSHTTPKSTFAAPSTPNTNFVPQTAPRPAPPPKHTPQVVSASNHRTKIVPPQNAHSRHKSLPFGSDPRFRTSSTYASARYDSGSSSPFSYGIMQPPGLGTSPSLQNGQLFQAQARARSSSSASAHSLTTPMTSSALRPTSSASSQGLVGIPQAIKPPSVAKPAPPSAPFTPPSSSVVQKYAFFQVHHNRDSTKYRTPYAHWGGFTNGYEGSLRAHLMKSPDALFGTKTGSSGLMDIAPQPVPTPGAGDSRVSANTSTRSLYGASYNGTGHSTQSSHGLQPGSPHTPSPHGPTALRMVDGSWDATQIAATLHPAIRVQYAALVQKKRMLAQQAEAQDHAAVPSLPQQSHQLHQSRGHQIAQGPQVSHQNFPGNMSAHAQPPGQSPGARRGSPFHNNSTPEYQSRPPPPKQTFVPPPRPWEQIQKLQQPGILSQSAPLMPLGTMTNREHGPLPPIPGQGLQPSNSQPATASQSVPVLPCVAVKTAVPTATPPMSEHYEEFPEVPQESAALVEEIIRQARRASGESKWH